MVVRRRSRSRNQHERRCSNSQRHGDSYMEIFVGTAGWSNPIWNPDGLLWYQKHSRLNAVELNMSFFQLPTKMHIDEWRNDGKDLRWTVKVNRAVTHLFRFNQTAKEHFAQFRDLFAPMDNLIDY